MRTVKIGIGAPTYNSVERLSRLLSSLILYTDYDRSLYDIVILDDGTPDINMRNGVRELAERFDIDFIQHEKNEGIPKSWNDLVGNFNSEISVLFNDDIALCDPNWLKCAIYALEQNEKIAAVGFPLVQINPDTGLPNQNYQLPDVINSRPGAVGAVVGCSFAMKKKVFNEIGKFDERFLSFYEETDWGFRVAEKGYYSVMLSYPCVEHYGSQSFGRNFEICIQRPIESLCSMDEYKKIMSKKFSMDRIEPIPNFVYRMDYSRVLFALKWGAKDFWDAPQVEVHHRLLDNRDKLKMKYLDSNLVKQEYEI